MGFKSSGNKITPVDDGGSFDTGDVGSVYSTSAASEAAIRAANSAIAAATSETNAATSETNAATSETNAAASETNAANSAVASATSATASASSASAANTSETNAATSETNAATSATNAATSEANADTSETNAAASATSASNSATTATTQASNASTSASEAATSATNAATSETNAATSETNAANSATNAATSEANAATSETNAATSETNAAASESAASSSETNAATYATNSATSATNAATSESNAATSETNAASSASSALASADAALAALDNFDDRYLGQKASDPTLDNDGNALVAGAIYFNTTDDVMRVYEGSVWVAAYASLAGTLLVANNLSDLANVTSARANLGLGTAATTAATDYATSAQGTLADSAVQPNDNPSFGSITVTGTVDGRDVATDGAKLDGIEALADVTDTTNVTAAGALMDSEVTNLAQVKSFDSSDYATAAQGALADSAIQSADLATVATTGAYSDLSGTPTLGTAAAANTTDFDAAGTALALSIALG